MLDVLEAFGILNFFNFVMTTYYLHGEIEILQRLSLHTDIYALTY
jgi:hypothetical protein